MPTSASPAVATRDSSTPTAWCCARSSSRSWWTSCSARWMPGSQPAWCGPNAAPVSTCCRWSPASDRGLAEARRFVPKDTTDRVSDYPNSAMARPCTAVEDSPVNEYRQTVIDDRYMADWLEFGFSELSAYLAKQARFE